MTGTKEMPGACHRDQHDRHPVVRLDSRGGTNGGFRGMDSTEHRTNDSRANQRQAPPGGTAEGGRPQMKLAYASFAALPSNPNLSAMPCNVPMQNAMCSSRSTPRAAAPLTMSSRFTLRAKALSFIRFRTDFASTSASDFPGLTSAQAVMNP